MHWKLARFFGVGTFGEGHRNFRWPPKLSVLLIFFVFCLEWLGVDSFFELLFFKVFSWLLWAVLSWVEQVCEIFESNSIWIKLLTQEPLLIVWLRTKNYTTSTKSSVIHLLMTRDTRRVLNLSKRVIGTLELRGLLSHLWDINDNWFFFKTHVSSIRSLLIAETYHMHLWA